MPTSLQPNFRKAITTARFKGFTLIEALVAMTIISVALLACMKAAGNLNLQQADLLQRQYAQWSVSNMANHIRVSGIFPSQSRTTTRCDQANYQFTCSAVISNTPDANFRRVELTVSNLEDAEYDLARIVVFLSNAP